MIKFRAKEGLIHLDNLNLEDKLVMTNHVKKLKQVQLVQNHDRLEQYQVHLVQHTGHLDQIQPPMLKQQVLLFKIPVYSQVKEWWEWLKFNRTKINLILNNRVYLITEVKEIWRKSIIINKRLRKVNRRNITNGEIILN